MNQMDYFKAFSPLHIAAATGQVDIINDLLAAGADRGLKDAEGRMPIDLASGHGHNEIVEILSH